MAETTEPYEVAVTGQIYRVVHEDNEGVRRICVHSGGQFRFSLPGDTPDEQVRTFIQVYALGIVDGQSARSTPVEDHIQGRLNLAARRLGQAIGKLKAGVPVTLAEKPSKHWDCVDEGSANHPYSLEVRSGP